MPDVETAQYVDYATPVARAPGVGPGLALGMLGLGLVLLGGCFCIGIMILYQSSTTDWSKPGVMFFLVVLYTLAAACFAGALLLLTLAARSLLRSGAAAR